MFKRVWNVFTTVLVVVSVALACFLAAARLFGAGAYAVLSGSMEPTYHVGSMLYVEKVDPAQLAVGDAITFMAAEDTVVTHRIVEIGEGDDGSLRFTTKGDANESADAGAVDMRNVIGRPVFSVPLLGYALYYVGRPPGMFIAIAAVAAILLVNVLLGMNDQE